MLHAVHFGDHRIPRAGEIETPNFALQNLLDVGDKGHVELDGGIDADWLHERRVHVQGTFARVGEEDGDRLDASQKFRARVRRQRIKAVWHDLR